MNFKVPFVLASGSPRRKKLLQSMGFQFLTHPASVEEEPIHSELPKEMAERLAEKKAEDVAKAHPSALVLGSDTIVVLNGQVLGKPTSQDEAKSMLSALSGRSHRVITGISLHYLPSGMVKTVSETTKVFFTELSQRDIDSYVSSEAPMDKAGAYGIQDDRGAYFVSRIEGDYYTVMGLPLFLLHQTLRHHFAELILDS